MDRTYAGQFPPDVPPDERTAEMPDSWLVVHNSASPDSVAWASWYANQWEIPVEHVFGAPMSLSEHLDTLAEVQAQVIGPVRTYLDSNPAIKAKIMGIVVGFDVPGHYAAAPFGGPGGYSVADAFKDLTDDTDPPAVQKGVNSTVNPWFADPRGVLPAGGRLFKSDLPEHRYFAARIDAPTLELAYAMTTRAKAISRPTASLAGQCTYYDFIDLIGLPVAQWDLLVDAQSSPNLADLTWCEFDADTDATMNAAFRFGTHDLVGWNDERLYSDPIGSKVLAYNLNSYGATTVRSTTASGGRYVPNAIAGGYAAAIGATGEPFCCLGPMPEILLSCLQEGWTLGESYYISSTFDDWMWTLVGDPLLRVPAWFDEIPNTVLGDISGDGRVDGRDLGMFAEHYVQNANVPGDWGAADLSGDGVINDDDAFLFLAPLLFPNEAPGAVLRGTADLNGDDRMDGRDVQLFLALLLQSDGNVSLRQSWGADMNQDEINDINDIPLFVEKLITHSPQ